VSDGKRPDGRWLSLGIKAAVWCGMQHLWTLLSLSGQCHSAWLCSRTNWNSKNQEILCQVLIHPNCILQQVALKTSVGYGVKIVPFLNTLAKKHHTGRIRSPLSAPTLVFCCGPRQCCQHPKLCKVLGILICCSYLFVHRFFVDIVCFLFCIIVFIFLFVLLTLTNLFIFY